MQSTERAELDLNRANERFYRAFESLDIREMEKVWATGSVVRCIHPGWGLRSGWPAVRDSWVLIFNNTARIQLEITDVESWIYQDIGWVNCVEHVTTYPEGHPQTGRVLATNLFQKIGREWLMIHHHGSPIFTR